MAKNDKAPQVDSPDLLDRIIGNVQIGLADNLDWLNVAYGRAERLVKQTQAGKKYYTPAVYKKGNDYTELTPDANVGNFCFFWVDDPQDVSTTPGVQVGIETTFSLIFWFDYRTIFGRKDNRNKEAVKREILDLLNGGIKVNAGRVTINKIYELAENIYKGFSLDEIENQFLMHPYGGFRFEGTMKISAACKY